MKKAKQLRTCFNRWQCIDNTQKTMLEIKKSIISYVNNKKQHETEKKMNMSSSFLNSSKQNNYFNQ